MKIVHFYFNQWIIAKVKNVYYDMYELYNSAKWIEGELRMKRLLKSFEGNIAKKCTQVWRSFAVGNSAVTVNTAEVRV